MGIARSYLFEQLTLAVIAINTVWIAVDTDYNDQDVLSRADPVFQIAEHLFCTYFVTEWAIRFAAFEQKRNGLKDYAFVFDSALVLMMVLETWVLTVVLSVFASGANGVNSLNLEILRLARLLRLTRMARMARLLRALPELMVLIKGISLAARSVFFTLLLLLIVVYVFGIAFTTLSKGSSLEKIYFGSVLASMSSLFLGGTFPDQKNMVTTISEEHLLYAALFQVFVLLATLTVMNMMVAVVVQVVQVVSTVEKEQIQVNFVKSLLKRVMKDSPMDPDGETKISKFEFKALLEKPTAVRALQNINVDVVGLVDITDYIFEDDDIVLSFTEFMEILLQLRGTNKATVKDIVDLRKFFLQELQFLEMRLTRVCRPQDDPMLPLPLTSRAWSEGSERPLP